jgi:serine/threonine protein kinase
MERDAELEARLASFVEQHVHGESRPSPASLCPDRPDLVEPLGVLIASYLRLVSTLETDAGIGTAPGPPADLPQFEGFHTIERLAAGGMGEVYKLRDLKLDRVVAAKVVRRDREAAATFREFLGEARALALFRDPRIVQIFEFRPEASPPVIVMEFVEGFELGRLGPSLEFRQRARIVEQVADVLHRAHGLGIQHRDLKPSNIMLDAALAPKVLDFGLSASDPSCGHLRGTLAYLAPEQLDPRRSIDARTDIYALGVILYELLCGTVPYVGTGEAVTIAAIRAGSPRLPVEVEPGVPEPLQAIALKAMASDPAERYQSAQEMALDLRRYLEGRPVLARPSIYASALETRVRPHIDHIDEWRRLGLVYPHEASRLTAAYSGLDVREDEWILSSRALSWSQIALYLGAFFLIAGALFFFGAYVRDAVSGVRNPFLVLGVPFLGLNLAAHHLHRKGHRAVAVAFYLGGVALLPLFLMIFLNEAHLLAVPKALAEAAGQLFTHGKLSNRQLQITIFVACLWAGFLAIRTRTIALSTVFTLLVFLMSLAILSDFGLRRWVLENQEWDRLALHLAPLAVVYGALGYGLERYGRPWFARPLYLGAALTFVLVVELLAQNGKTIEYLGLSMEPLMGQATDPVLLETLTAMTFNGLLMYVVAMAIERGGSQVMQRAGGLLFTLSPFAALKPLGYLSMQGDYSRHFDWLLLVLALGSCVLSHRRQRLSFYYAGLINIGWALFEIADHNLWRDKPTWAIALVTGGLVALAGGFFLDRRERLGRRGRV